ncbi:MAG: DNA polymerase III subunit [Nitrospirae bacterium]|nr:DNA polymerase III subunit [Nitrospirota bacterium]
MALKNIIGQDKALRIFRGTLMKDSVPSAVILAGENGVGKRLAALNYSKAINCLEPDDFDCCDKCISCKKIDSSVHPDVLTVTLENAEDALSLEVKKGKDKKRYEYPIEAVHKIEEMLYLCPYEGRKKVIIIDDSDVMNINAANAFLKTLEEPPLKSLIMLITSNPDSLPDTIRSRCMSIRFNTLSTIDSRMVVAEKLGDKFDKSTFNLIMGLVMGRPGIALSRDFKEESERFMRQLNNMLQGGNSGIWADKSEIRLWLDTVFVFLRDALVYAITDEDDAILLTGAASLSRRNRQAQRSDIDIKRIIEAYDRLQRVEGLLDFNLNKAITWNYVSGIMKDLKMN